MSDAIRIGAVVIGRNEGERLRSCLASIVTRVDQVVYVDSGSADGSLELARQFGVDAIALDTSRKFTAARARNAGMERLRADHPDIELVQLIDGDCELDANWLTTAVAAMARLPKAAIVCGRRRERHPEASIYNGFCDREWDTPLGEIATCGGDALIRIRTVLEVGGFSPELIAGEEPDLCHRLRANGWKIHRIAAEMTRHDAAITRFGQWWSRNKRSGYAYAEAWSRRGATDPLPRRRVLNNIVWALPVAWLLWPLLWWRVFRRSDAAFAFHIVLGKLPHCHGQFNFWLDQLHSRHRGLIEYK